nr:hypothetical protein [Tanacetum cinerariifolium]
MRTNPLPRLGEGIYTPPGAGHVGYWKVRKGKPSLKLVDEEEEVQHEPEPQDEETDADLELALKTSLDFSQPQGQVKDKAADLERALKMSLDSIQAQSQRPVRGVAIRKGVTEEIQKLLDVAGKGKAIVTEEQAVHSLLDLHKSKKKNSTSVAEKKSDSERTKSGTEAEMPEGAEDQAGSEPRKALPPPSPTESPTDQELVARVAALERRNAELEHAFTVQHKKLKTLPSKSLLWRIMVYKPRSTIMSMRRSIRRMFESSSYKSHTDHEILYNALDLSMDRNHQDELHEELSKSRKRRRDDQDPPPPNDKDQDPPSLPPKDSKQNKKKNLDSDAFISTQHPAHPSLTWATTDTPSSSSKQHQTSPFGGPTEDVPIPYEVHNSNIEDTKNAYLLKITTTADWFRPIPEEERPATPEPEWSIPPNDFPEADNSWANAFVTIYQDPEENKLLRKTYDMGSFIKLFCKRIEK